MLQGPERPPGLQQSTTGPVDLSALPHLELERRLSLQLARKDVAAALRLVHNQAAWLPEVLPPPAAAGHGSHADGTCRLTSRMPR
jgi:hypothetical protein